MHCWHFRIFYKKKKKKTKAAKASFRKQQRFFSITVIYNSSRAQTQNNMFPFFTGAIMPIKLQYVELNKWKSSSSCPSHLHFSSMLYENWQSCFSCACSIVASVGTFCKTMCSTCQSSFFRMGKKNNFSDFYIIAWLSVLCWWWRSEDNDSTDRGKAQLQ